MALEGLSRGQRQEIAKHFAGFLLPDTESLALADVVCWAAQLSEPIRLTQALFTVDGQYTPRKRRTDSGVEITGFNSRGHFERTAVAPLRASLSVACEDELAQPFVLENFLRTLIAYRVLDQGGVLLHSVGVLHQGHAYLFSGRSNAGKTTLARKAAAGGARVLSDDINLVIPGDGGFQAHKVPFTGEFGRQVENRSGLGSFPLGGLALLEKAPRLAASPVRPAEAVAGLLTGCPFVNDDAEELPVLVDVLTRLVSEVPVLRLGVGLEDPFEAVITRMTRVCEHV